MQATARGGLAVPWLPPWRTRIGPRGPAHPTYGFGLRDVLVGRRSGCSTRIGQRRGRGQGRTARWYKAGFEWSKPNRDLKYELVRDLIALANTKDGGRVVFGVRDSDLEFVGVPVEIFESIDPTDIVGMLHDNAAPNVRCAVYKREIDGKRVVVLDVAEFEDTPIICTKAIVCQDGSKRLILRQAAIYARTGRALHRKSQRRTTCVRSSRGP